MRSPGLGAGTAQAGGRRRPALCDRLRRLARLRSQLRDVATSARFTMRPQADCCVVPEAEVESELRGLGYVRVSVRQALGALAAGIVGVVVVLGGGSVA